MFYSLVITVTMSVHYLTCFRKAKNTVLLSPNRVQYQASTVRYPREYSTEPLPYCIHHSAMVGQV